MLRHCHGYIERPGDPPSVASAEVAFKPSTTPTMQLNFANYLQHLANALLEKKGLELAYLLSPREEHGKTVLKEFRNPTVSLQRSST